jgi:hypothetical protein
MSVLAGATEARDAAGSLWEVADGASRGESKPGLLLGRTRAPRVRVGTSLRGVAWRMLRGVRGSQYANREQNAFVWWVCMWSWDGCKLRCSKRVDGTLDGPECE